MMPTYFELTARQNQIQIHQLALLNMQVQQQQQAAAFQANISQALFETEKAARRVHATLRHDPLAAAILAQSWGRRIQGLHAGLFHDLQSKHAWTNACSTLDGATRAARNDGRLASHVDGYFGRLDALDALVSTIQRLGGHPENPHDTLVAPAERRATEGNPSVPMYAAMGSGFVFIGGAAVDGGLGFLGLIALVGSGFWWFAWHQERGRRLRAVSAARQAVANYVAFQENPDGGGWLRDVWARHPLIFSEPSHEEPQALQSQGGTSTYVERKLVERQVVVVRCKFCKQLAPVDLPTCEHCGAPGFGS